MVRQPYFWLIVMLLASMLAAVYLMFGLNDLPGNHRPEAAALAAGDQEIAWLNPATNPYTWTRMVAGFKFLVLQHPEWKLTLDESELFPDQTATQPALGIRRAGVAGTLWLRWYKLTGQQSTADWVKELLARRPAPLALVGGGSSDRARELAIALASGPARLADPPLLCLTTATADEVEHGGQRVNLMSLHPGRSFRFCFTNQQMAGALLQFLWREPSLRPTRGPAFLLAWRDDPYSLDLIGQFRGWIESGRQQAGDLEASRRFPEVTEIWERLIPHSISRLTEPNDREVAAVQDLLQALAEGPPQERALLVIPAEAKAARRVLRTLFRDDPAATRRWVATPGDTVAFNTLYRDRRAQWPIQELPLPLVIFCHRNPVSLEAGFGSEEECRNNPQLSMTSTDDLLLFASLGEALLEAALPQDGLIGSPSAVGERLRGKRTRGGQPFFDHLGNLRPNSGEHLVLLEPRFAGERVLPQAVLSVFALEGGGEPQLRRQLLGEYGPPAAPASGQERQP